MQSDSGLSGNWLCSAEALPSKLPFQSWGLPGAGALFPFPLTLSCRVPTFSIKIDLVMWFLFCVLMVLFRVSLMSFANSVVFSTDHLELCSFVPFVCSPFCFIQLTLRIKSFVSYMSLAKLNAYIFVRSKVSGPLYRRNLPQFIF